MLFLKFFVLFVSVAAMDVGTYPVQREDFVSRNGERISNPLQHQPAGVYRVDRSDYPGAPSFMFPYPYYYPAPQTQYWSPPRSYNYRSYEANRPKRPIIPEPVISTSQNYPKLFIPASNQVFYAPKVVPIVTRKPKSLTPMTTPDSDDEDDNNEDDSVLPATRLSPDESEPLAALSTNAKKVSKKPNKYHSYNDDVEINDEQRDLLAGFYKGFRAPAKELPAQADRFRRQAMYVIDVPTQDVDVDADENTPLPAEDPNRVPSSVDLVTDELPYNYSFYELLRREGIPLLDVDSPFSIKNYMEDNKVTDGKDEFPPKRYLTQFRTSSEISTEEAATTPPAADIYAEDIAVIFEAETEVKDDELQIIGFGEEKTSPKIDADVQFSLQELLSLLNSGPPSDDEKNNDDALAQDTAADELNLNTGVRHEIEIEVEVKMEENLDEQRESSFPAIEQERTILYSAEPRDLIYPILFGREKGDQTDEVYRGGDDEGTNIGNDESETTTRIDGTDEVDLQQDSSRQFLLTLKKESIHIDVLSPSLGRLDTFLAPTTTTMTLTAKTSGLDLVGVLRRLAEESDIIEKNAVNDMFSLTEFLNRLKSTETSISDDLKPEEETEVHHADSLETTVPPPTTTRSHVEEFDANSEEEYRDESNTEIPNDSSDD